MTTRLQNHLALLNAPHPTRGIYSVCSAHPWVIRAAVGQALDDGTPLLIEATSNQVNQHGGYTGMQPADFRRLVLDIAADAGLPADRILLGGDHLGPNPWQKSGAAEAMAAAKVMIAQYAAAGFAKLHLDASMPCADDHAPLSEQLIASRAADLCEAAEDAAATGLRPMYIIGTEVPVPGGATEAMDHLAVTSPAAAAETLRIHRETFHARGLDRAWERVVGLVVQPGVEFNHDTVVDYVPEKARDLTSLLRSSDGLVFEAHSTDYQRPEAYKQLVHDGFAILKVGPALTFAMREALFALAAIEAELIPAAQRSSLPDVMEAAMLGNPAQWSAHYHGTPEQQRLLRRYSYSDRMRYYWTDPSVTDAVERLLANLNSVKIPDTLLSAWLPRQFEQVRSGSLRSSAVPLILAAIRHTLVPYADACR